MPEPISTGAAILGAAGIGALASSQAGRTQARAAETAANVQAQSAREANELQRRIYEENVARQQPFLTGGMEDYNRLRALSMGGPEAAQRFLSTDPGYGFRLSEGMKALERGAAARGGLVSGAALRAAQRYGQDLASQEYGAAYNRLAGLADVGPRAAGVLTNLGTQFGEQSGRNLMMEGQALGQGYLGAGGARASAYMGGANALTGGLSQYLNYMQNQNLLNTLLANRSGMQYTPGAGGGFTYGAELPFVGPQPGP